MATLPFKGGMASARRNNSIILFGGENATNSFTDDLYQLTQLTDTFNWQRLPQTNTPPGNLYGQAIITSNNDAMYLLGGMTNTTNNQIAPLQIYQYTFDNHSWNAAPTNTAQVSTNSTSIPLNRKLFSATYDSQNKVYIYGGALNASAIFPDFYVLDLSTNQFAALPNPGVPRYSHTSSLLRYVNTFIYLYFFLKKGVLLSFFI
jgi:N-acetylneuraminic acid mutarotase